MRCNICARIFRTNRGLLQHLNFCPRRNRHEEDNPNGTIQVKNKNQNNLNNKEIDKINDSTNSCQNNQNENQKNL